MEVLGTEVRVEKEVLGNEMLKKEVRPMEVLQDVRAKEFLQREVRPREVLEKAVPTK